MTDMDEGFVSEENEDETESESSAPPVPPPNFDYKSAYEKERQEKKRIYSQLKTYKQRDIDQLKAEFPLITDEDIKGLSPQQVRNLLSKVAPPTSSQDAPSSSTSTPPSAPSEGVASGRAFAAGGLPPLGVAAQGEQITATEAQRRLQSREWTHAQYVQALASGQVRTKPKA